MHYNKLHLIWGVPDLNAISAVSCPFRLLLSRGTNVLGQDTVFANHGLCAVENLSPDCRQIRRRLSRPHAFLCRTFSRSGICTTDVSRKPSGYRSLSCNPSGQAVSHGRPLSGKTLHFGRCQRTSGLAYLRGTDTKTDHASASTLCRRTLWGRFERHCLRAGYDDHRSVFVGFSLGSLSDDQSRGKIAYLARFERQYPEFYSYQRWQAARSQCARPVAAGAGGVLHHGPGLSRFREAAPVSYRWKFLCHSRQGEPEGQTALLPYGGQIDGPYLRSVGYFDGILLVQRLRRLLAKNSIQRSENRQNAGVSDQQFHVARIDDYRTLSMSLAGRTVLQMDQTTSSHQNILRDVGECRENTNLDGGFRIRPGCHYQKAPQSRRFALHFITGIFSHPVRENPFKSRISRQHPFAGGHHVS